MYEENRVYKWYLVTIIIYSCITILSKLIGTILGDSIIGGIIQIMQYPLNLGMFIFNIVMFILFIAKKIEKTAWILPGLGIFNYIFSPIIIAIVILILTELEDLLGRLVIPIITTLAYISVIIIPVIVLIIAIKLIRRPQSREKISSKLNL